METVEEGKIILFSEGSYSDYGVLAVGRATRTFTMGDAYEQFRIAHPDAARHARTRFVCWLIAEAKWVEETEFHEIWGNYNRAVEEMLITKETSYLDCNDSTIIVPYPQRH